MPHRTLKQQQPANLKQRKVSLSIGDDEMLVTLSPHVSTVVFKRTNPPHQVPKFKSPYHISMAKTNKTKK
jgi:hypothetical protein